MRKEAGGQFGDTTYEMFQVIRLASSRLTVVVASKRYSLTGASWTQLFTPLSSLLLFSKSN